MKIKTVLDLFFYSMDIDKLILLHSVVLIFLKDLVELFIKSTSFFFLIVSFIRELNWLKLDKFNQNYYLIKLENIYNSKFKIILEYIPINLDNNWILSKINRFD